MTRTPRWAAALVLALVLPACGGAADDDPTLDAGSAGSPAAPVPSVSVPAAGAAPTEPAPACPLAAQPIAAPAGVGKDLGVAPQVPANAGAVPTKVQVADVVVGTGATAVTGSPVAVKYVGALDKTGKVFDASWKRGPKETLPFTACGQDVVPGFSIAPIGMKVGGRRLVRIPDEFGYPGGNPGAGIPAGAAITFVIDLVSVG